MPLTRADLLALPAPQMVDRVVYAEVLAGMVADVQSIDPEFEARDSDPGMTLIRSFATYAYTQRQYIAMRAQAQLLPYATGPDLDNLASLVGIIRRDGQDDEQLRAAVLDAPLAMVIGTAPEIIKAVKDAVPGHVRAATAVVDDMGIAQIRMTATDAFTDRRAVNHRLSGWMYPEDVATIIDYLNDPTRKLITVEYNIKRALIKSYRIVGDVRYKSRHTDLQPLRLATYRRAAEFIDGHVVPGLPLWTSAVAAALFGPGVEDVKLTLPVDTEADPDSAWSNAKTVKDGLGLPEDEFPPASGHSAETHSATWHFERTLLGSGEDIVTFILDKDEQVDIPASNGYLHGLHVYISAGDGPVIVHIELQDETEKVLGFDDVPTGVNYPTDASWPEGILFTPTAGKLNRMVISLTTEGGDTLSSRQAEIYHAPGGVVYSAVQGTSDASIDLNFIDLSPVED